MQALKHSYEIRISRWNDFRQHIAARAKMQFGAYLANRDFGGRLSFDHEKLRLKLRVTTAAAAAGEKGKGADALSGGEKSFSTICFLLTMWEAIGAPIRCLDEFVRHPLPCDFADRAQDVFMVISLFPLDGIH